jgi:hypothetical protein
VEDRELYEALTVQDVRYHGTWDLPGHMAMFELQMFLLAFIEVSRTNFPTIGEKW